MARMLRFVPRDGLVEVALRCADGEMLLAPDPEVQRRLLGVLGRALDLFPVLLHAYQFMSNHLHMLMTVADAHRMATFMGYLAKQGGDAIREIRGARRVWESRYWHRCIVTDAESIGRLRYILSNGVKEGLVERPEDWPGISSTQALVEQRDVHVRWSTARQRRSAVRRGRTLDEIGIPYVIRLTPLPALANRSGCALRGVLFAMCRDIEREGRLLRAGRACLGVDAVRNMDPRSKHPLEPRPAAQRGRLGRARRAWRELEQLVTREHRRATELRRSGVPDAPYPVGCFAPGRQFVPWPKEGQPLHV